MDDIDKEMIKFMAVGLILVFLLASVFIGLGTVVKAVACHNKTESFEEARFDWAAGCMVRLTPAGGAPIWIHHDRVLLPVR